MVLSFRPAQSVWRGGREGNSRMEQNGNCTYGLVKLNLLYFLTVISALKRNSMMKKKVSTVLLKVVSFFLFLVLQFCRALHRSPCVPE